MNHFSRRWMAGLGVGAAAMLFGGAAQGQEGPSPRRVLIQHRAAESDDDQLDTFDIENPRDVLMLFGEAEATPDDAEAGERPIYWLGIDAAPADDTLRSQLDLPRGQGLAIERVIRGTPAARAGIRPHDILLSVDGKSVGRMASLAEAVNAAAGKEIAIKVLRGGRTVTLMATPAPRPANPPADRAMTDNAMATLSRPTTIAARRLEAFRDDGDGPRVAATRLIRPASGMITLTATAKLRPDLPDDVSVDIHREGKKPARITVQKGNEKWEVSEDDLSKLPEPLRQVIAPLLSGGPMPNGAWTATSAPMVAPFTPGAAPGMTEGRFSVALPGPNDMRGQLDAEQHRFADVARNLQEIQHALGQLAAHQQQADSDHRQIEELSRQLNEMRGAIREMRAQQPDRDDPPR